jgi:hypothetical protein
MRKLFLVLMVLLTNITFSQSIGEELGKSLYKLINKEENSSKNFYKEIVNETVVINSSSNARFSGGKTRSGVKINLPQGTIKWVYRITLLSAKSYYSYPYEQTLFNLISNNQKYIVNNQTNYGVDFYIIDDYDINNFLQTGNDNFNYYSKYSKLNTTGFVSVSDLLKNNLWIGVKNPNVTEGLKVIIEVVAFGDFN